MFILYKITNRETKKAYVGWTSDLKRRWGEHANPSSQCRYLSRAIQKYGIDKFQVEILTECSTETEAKALEISNVKDLKTKAPHGYNLTDGGDGAVGRVHSEAAKRKMSLHHRATPHSEETKRKISANNGKGMLGRKHSEVTKQKISTAKKGIKYGTGMLGKKHSEETKQKIRTTKALKRKMLGEKL